MSEEYTKIDTQGMSGGPIKKGSSRINAAVHKGYDAIEGIIINA